MKIIVNYNLERGILHNLQMMMMSLVDYLCSVNTSLGSVKGETSI